MKRCIAAITAALALCAMSATAQSADEPDAQSVLEHARDKYDSSNQSDQTPPQPDESAPAQTESDQSASDAEQSIETQAPEREHTLFQLFLVPGVSTPQGFYDADVALGLVGTASGRVSGIAAAGVFNLADGDVRGFQAAGVFNLAERVEGFQGSGVFNMAGDVEGFQGSGVFNMAGDVEGFQGAGVFNMAGDVEGFQGAGVFNMAGHVDGCQFAGVFNIADSNDGVMIGLVNVVDEADGLVIGLVNIVGNGILDAMAWYQPDGGMCYAGMQSGTKSFYGIYYAGSLKEDLFRDKDTLVLGFGFGHRVEMNSGYFDVDASYERYFGPSFDSFLKEVSASPETVDLSPGYLSLRASVGAPIAGSLQVFGGVKVDVDLANADSVPAFLRDGLCGADGASGKLFDLPWRAWPKLFVGLKL